jgi:hypothetical protein
MAPNYDGDLSEVAGPPGQARDKPETCPGSNLARPRSLNAPRTAWGAPGTDLVRPGTIGGLPGSFSAPRTGPLIGQLMVPLLGLSGFQSCPRVQAR